MKEHLEVKNFGPIKDISIELKPVMVFIGAQATGKSAIAKLIAIFRSKEFIIETRHDTKEVIFNKVKKTFDKLLKEYDIDSYLSNNTYIKFTTESYTFDYENESRKPVINYKSGKKSSNEPVNYAEYIPAERIFITHSVNAIANLITNDFPLPKTFMNLNAEYEKARKGLITLDLKELLNVRYRFENSEDKVSLDGGKDISLTKSASGFQSVIPMLVIIEHKIMQDSKNNYTFIIEEPELSLFPTTQKKLTRILIEKCATKNHELVITTHSPYILSSLNNQLFANRISLKKEDVTDKVNAIIPKECWIHSERFAAYEVANGEAKSIVDDETGMISETELDSASEEINIEFDELMDIYKAKGK